MSENNILIISKKHWWSYIPPPFTILFVVLLFLGFYFSYTKELTIALSPIAVFFIIKYIYVILVNLTTTWTLTTKYLIIKSGFLPWKKYEAHVPIFNIYEARYSKSFLGTFLGFANLIIHDTKGNTSRYFEKTMNRPRKITSAINGLIAEIQTNNETEISKNTDTISITSELRNLAALKDEGIISENEYSLLKSKIINQA